MRDSCGTGGQVRPLKAHSGKGLTACPAESEQSGAQINLSQKLHSIYQKKIRRE
ncbi:hypothetical protein [Fictibacillus sp. UD]|uniref:hypothetical protein n=1 Tax=Fictibacillus sp. UD TaxID=3038777 RepID=UPI003748F43A